MRVLLLILLSGLIALPTRAQEQQQRPRPLQKDPSAATVFAIVLPGGGHIYAGETTKGLVMLGTATAAPVAGSLLGRESTVPRWTGSLVAIGIWIYSLVDAAPAARRANARNGYAVSVRAAVNEQQPALAVQVTW